MDISGFSEMTEGFTEFAEGLQETSDDIEDIGEEVADETAQGVAEDASEFAPVDEGKLQESIFVSPFSAGPMRKRVIVGARYGRWVEYGTYSHVIPPSIETSYDEPIEHPGASPKPYLRPALYANKETMHREFEQQMEDAWRRNL